MKTLILDNYDSFTYNLYQYVAELGGEPVVYRNDESGIEEIAEHCRPFERPQDDNAKSFTHIILSPGPGNPDTVRDIGISREIIDLAEKRRIPLLGVCLGHQTLAVHFGGTVERAPEIFHGRASNVSFSDPHSVLFQDFSESIEAMRYHSLCVTKVPELFRATAQTDEGMVMAMEHKELPLYGIQFHPESIGTPDGKTILKRFLLIS